MAQKDSIGGYIIEKGDRQYLSQYFDEEIIADVSARSKWEHRKAVARQLLYPEEEESKLGPEYANIKVPAIGDVLRLRPRYRDAILGDGRDIVQLMPVGPEDIQTAQLRTKYENWELVNEAHIFKLTNSWLFDTLVDGNGWVKNRHVVKVARVIGASGQVEQKVVFDGAKPIVVPPSDIIVPRSATHGDDVQSLERIGHVVRWNVFQAKNQIANWKKSKRGFVDEEAIAEFMRLYGNPMENLYQKIPKVQDFQERIGRTRNEEYLEQQRIAGVWTTDDYRRTAVEVYFEFDATPGRISDAQQYVGYWSPDTGRLLAAREIFGYRPRPLHKMTAFPTDTFYGVGLPIVLKVWLEIYAAIFNASVNYALLSNLPWGVSASGRGKNKRIRLVPGEIATGVPADTKFPSVQRLDGSFFKILEIAKGNKGELGSSDLFSGNSRNSAGANAAATTVIGLIEQASVTMGDIGEGMIDDFRDFVAYRVDMNRRNLSESKKFRVLNSTEVVFEDISKTDFPDVDPDVVIGRNSSAAFRSLKQQVSQLMYQTLSANPLIAPSPLNSNDPTRLQALTRAFMKDHDFDRPDVLPDPPTQQEETQNGINTGSGIPGANPQGAEGVPGGAAIPSLVAALGGNGRG